MSEIDADAFSKYRYPPPYDPNDSNPDSRPAFLSPSQRYFAVVSDAGLRFGYCCFGAEARVPGGAYAEAEPEFLDVGVGMAPEWAGQGFGPAFAGAVLAYGRERHAPQYFRVTVARANDRSLRLWRRLGFESRTRFEHAKTGAQFEILVSTVVDGCRLT